MSNSFNLICAVALNGVIGDSQTNSIPWYLPTDLKYFKNKTFNHTVIMGSNTYHSIGKPLRDRRNVVITRNLVEAARLKNEDGVDEVYSSFAQARQGERPGFFVIGGQHIYGEALHYNPERMFITIVELEPIACDVHFPITGERFKNDKVVLQNGTVYSRVSQSGTLEENGIKFTFNEFVSSLHRH